MTIVTFLDINFTLFSVNKIYILFKLILLLHLSVIGKAQSTNTMRHLQQGWLNICIHGESQFPSCITFYPLPFDSLPSTFIWHYTITGRLVIEVWNILLKLFLGIHLLLRLIFKNSYWKIFQIFYAVFLAYI